ncbi:MAG TPA: OB-fold nucleic acid binding domain-containing protein, partial [Methylomirabilota bacterium]|nr:OB-fold nucleic acid binding domain-containing protein [Methylomirabilota bacterium]
VSAVIQDATGAIVLRVGGEVGALGRGELVEVDGTRSTLAGMETLRVTTAPRRAGTASEPSPRQLGTGDASENDEAMLVIVRGAVSSPRRAATGTISFDLDDGSGPLRVVIDGSLGLDAGLFVAGTWVEARGVLGQETTGAQPLSGYRVWPRGAADLRVTAVSDPVEAVTGASPPGRAPVGAPRRAAGGAASLAGIMSADLGGLRVAATLVAAEWPELAIGGLLWDGERLVVVAAPSADAVSGAIGSRRPPLVLELSGLRVVRLEHAAELPVVTASVERVSRGAGPVAAPVGTMPDPGAPAQWVSLVGRIVDEEGGPVLRHGSALVTLDFRCEARSPRRSGVVGVTGIGLASPARIIVPCDGLRAAPALHLRGGASPLMPPRDGAIMAAVSETPTGSDMASRWLAAALLGVSVIALVGAVVVRRWLDEDDPGGAELGAAGQEGSSGDRSEPALSLVSLPRERGSP